MFIRAKKVDKQNIRTTKWRGSLTSVVVTEKLLKTVKLKFNFGHLIPRKIRLLKTSVRVRV